MILKWISRKRVILDQLCYNGFKFLLVLLEYWLKSHINSSYLFLSYSHNYLLMISSVLYLLASYLLTGVCGSPGLILANCVNMAVRIVHSLKFIRDFFSTTSYHPLRRSVPSAKLLLSFTITSLVTAMSEVKPHIFKEFLTLCGVLVDLFLL